MENIGLGFKGIQMLTHDTRFIDLKKHAESKTYADELKAKLRPMV
jgi:hypothetical protein